MKISRKLILTALLPLTALAAMSCSPISPETTSFDKITPGTPGGEYVDTSTISATVTAINVKTRKVAMVTDQGKKFSAKAGPEVANFSQIRIGDRFNVELTEEIAIRMIKPGEKIKESGEITIGVAALGSKPGTMSTETYQITATVVSIDKKNRNATLKFSDGTTRKVAVRPDIDLNKHKVGEKVVIRFTEFFAISMIAP